MTSKWIFGNQLGRPIFSSGVYEQHADMMMMKWAFEILLSLAPIKVVALLYLNIFFSKCFHVLIANTRRSLRSHEKRFSVI